MKRNTKTYKTKKKKKVITADGVRERAAVYKKARDCTDYVCELRTQSAQFACSHCAYMRRVDSGATAAT